MKEVYVVYGANDEVLYVGKGVSGRSAHATSGISHNRELNKHLIEKDNPNEWLCYDGLMKEYWFRPAFHFQVSMWSNFNHKDFMRIPEDIRNQIKPMKLVLSEVEVFINGDYH